MADVLGARQWREENIAALMQAERDRDRLIALEAQARVLVQLVSDCAGIESEARIVVPEPAEPAEPFPTAPGAVRWGAIE
jgi:hypothetical protein